MMVSQAARVFRLPLYLVVAAITATGLYGLWRLAMPRVLFLAQGKYESLGIYNGSLQRSVGDTAWNEPYTVTLYARSNQLVGTLNIGETPYQAPTEGFLQGEWDKTAGTLSFKARVLTSPGAGGAELPELVEFRGKSVNNSLTGSLVRSSPLFDEPEEGVPTTLVASGPPGRALEPRDLDRIIGRFVDMESRWNSLARGPKVPDEVLEPVGRFFSPLGSDPGDGTEAPWYEFRMLRAGRQVVGQVMIHGTELDGVSADIEEGQFDPPSGNLVLRATAVCDSDSRAVDGVGAAIEFKGTLKGVALKGDLKLDRGLGPTGVQLLPLEMTRVDWSMQGREEEPYFSLARWEYRRIAIRSWTHHRWQIATSARSKATEPPASPSSPSEAPKAFHLLGIYSDVTVSDAEEEGLSYGRDLELWAQDTTLVGMFGEHGDLDGDQLRGPIRVLAWDPASKVLRFDVVLATGRRYNPGGGWDPVMERFTFDGRLDAGRVEGDLVRRVLRPVRGFPGTQHVNLPLDQAMTEDRQQHFVALYPDLKAWRTKNAPPSVE